MADRMLCLAVQNEKPFGSIIDGMLAYDFGAAEAVSKHAFDTTVVARV